MKPLYQNSEHLFFVHSQAINFILKQNSIKKIFSVVFLMLLFNFSFGAINPTEIELEKKESISVETSRTLAYDFPGWNRKQAITINSGQVDGSIALIDFPFLVTLDHLNSEVVDGGANSALNGGGDIRFSSDAAGNNPLAIEVVEFVTSATPANRRAQIWVKIPSLSPSVDTTISYLANLTIIGFHTPYSRPMI